MIYIPEHPAVWVLVFAVGAAIGSFLNVVIYRWPQRESIIRPPSHCMSCGARLGFIDLIPVLSYFLLRGRCRHCGRRFSVRYALVEAAVGLLLVGALGLHGLSVHGLAVFVVCCCLVLVFFIDLDHMIIPDELVVSIALIGIALNVQELVQYGPGTSAVAFTQRLGEATKTVYLPSSLVGLAVGGGAFLLVSWVFERLWRRPVLGFGDVKLAGGMGALVGPGHLFLAWFVLSVVVGAAVAVLLLATGLRRRRDYIPFGPMLAAGGIAVVLCPELGVAIAGLYGL